MNEYINTIDNEFSELEDFIQGKTKNHMENMNNKLDEVLLGPYYAAGEELMKTAKSDLETRIESKK